MDTHLTDKTREKILQLLKINGEMPVSTLSEELNVSGVNIRGHLSRMERDGLISMRCEKSQERGRPSYLYKLTERGQAHFPSAYNQLASDVLKQVKQIFGMQAINSIFAGRAQEFLEQLQEKFKSSPLEITKISELAELLRKMGYLVDVNAIGNNEYMLTIKHCPISQIAADFPEVCTAELNMQRQALNAQVSLRRTIPQGSSSCHYHIIFHNK
ncbi:MAG: transcriptional regulator [Acidobacteria bacterium]|nr:transcriptional regulator [Acidobacteriota bacterium]